MSNNNGGQYVGEMLFKFRSDINYLDNKFDSRIKMILDNVFCKSDIIYNLCENTRHFSGEMNRQTENIASGVVTIKTRVGIIRSYACGDGGYKVCETGISWL